MNEPDCIWLYADQTGRHLGDKRGRIPNDDYFQAIKGFADGVHEVDKTLRVAPGGYANPCYHGDFTCDGYAKVLAPLFNDGTLDGIDLHNYGENTEDWKASQQYYFDQTKKISGITADINHYCTEFNTGSGVENQKRFPNLSLEQSWGRRQRRRRLAAQDRLFHALHPLRAGKRPRLRHGRELDPFEPTLRAKTLKLVSDVTKGASFSLLEPHGSGIFILNAPDKKIWVWQNRPIFSWLAGNYFPLAGIPTEATTLKIYRSEDSADKPYRTIALKSQSQLQLNDLPANETLMFVADAPDDHQFHGLNLDFTTDGHAAAPGYLAVLGYPWRYCKALGFGYAAKVRREHGGSGRRRRRREDNPLDA